MGGDLDHFQDYFHIVQWGGGDEDEPRGTCMTC